MTTPDISLPVPAPDETTPYSLFGLAKAKAGKADALAARLLALVEPTRSEPGVLQYHVHRDRDDPTFSHFTKPGKPSSICASISRRPPSPPF
jgi:hypothetical protein